MLHLFLTTLKITRFILLTQSCPSIWDKGNLTMAKSHMNHHHRNTLCLQYFPYFIFFELFHLFNNQELTSFLTLMIFIQHMSLFSKQTDEQEVITFLLTTEIIPLCLRIMEAGSELSKTVSVVTARFLLPSGSPSQ